MKRLVLSWSATAAILAIFFVTVLGLRVHAQPNLACADGEMVVSANGQPSCATVLAPTSLPQVIRATTSTAGLYTWTYPTPYSPGVVPVIQAVVEGTAGSTDVINAQLNGAPTNTSVTIRITRTVQSVVSLLGLTILSIPAAPGAFVVDITAQAP